MKKYMKILSSITVAIIIMFLLSNFVLATDYSDPSVIQHKVDADTHNLTDIQTKGETILGVIQIVGTIISLGIIMVIGIRYMMGSVEEKAQYKKTMLPYVIGAILLFSATTIANIAYNIAKSLGG